MGILIDLVFFLPLIIVIGLLAYYELKPNNYPNE